MCWPLPGVSCAAHSRAVTVLQTASLQCFSVTPERCGLAVTAFVVRLVDVSHRGSYCRVSASPMQTKRIQHLGLQVTVILIHCYVYDQYEYSYTCIVYHNEKHSRSRVKGLTPFSDARKVYVAQNVWSNAYYRQLDFAKIRCIVWSRDSRHYNVMWRSRSMSQRDVTHQQQKRCKSTTD